MLTKKIMRVGFFQNYSSRGIKNWDVNKWKGEKDIKIMFAPNVWSFDPPNTHIHHKYSESNAKHEKQICKRIHSHPFNRVVSWNLIRHLFGELIQSSIFQIAMCSYLLANELWLFYVINRCNISLSRLFILKSK